MCCCRPPPGARRTARSPTPSGASRASARSCRCRARRGRTGGSCREVARAHGLRARRSPIARAADVFREHAALSAFENDGARDFDLGALADITMTRLRRARAGAMAGAGGRARAHERASSPTAASSRPTARRASSRPSRRRCAKPTSRRISVRAQHRPRARPVAHDDAHRHEPAARPRICRSRSSRCIRDDAAALGLADGGFARVATPHGACVLKVVLSDGQQPGSLFVPIHWSARNRSCGARRRAGRAAHRSVFRPARGQGDAGRDRAGRASRMRGFALSRRAVALPAGTWWARVAVRRRGIGTLSRPTQGPMVWRDFAYRAARRRGGAGRVCSTRAALSRGGLRRRRARRLPVRRPGRCAAAMGRREACSSEPTAAAAARRVLSAVRSAAIATAGDLRLLRGRRSKRLRQAIASDSAEPSTEIGKPLRAGTNCGSCLPELKQRDRRMNASRIAI